MPWHIATRRRSKNFNEHLTTFARNHGKDPGQAIAALDNNRLAALVQQDFEDGVAHGITRTPTALVNGKAFVETISFEEISQAIAAELAGVQI